jgi:HK97 gp10 family phage protein
MRVGGIALSKGSVVTGYQEIDAALAALEPKIQRKVVRGALRAGANRILGAALENIRTNPSIDEGKLLGALKVRALPRSRTSIGMAVYTKGAAHANIVEYGSKRMPAEPFLRPAGYNQKALIERMLIEDIQDAVANPSWKFKKEASAFAAYSRRQARKIATKKKRAKQKAAKKRAAR